MPLISKTKKLILTLAAPLIFLALLGGCSGNATPTQNETASPTMASQSPSEPTAVPATETTLATSGIPNENYYAPFPVNITINGKFEDWQDVPLVTLPANADQITGSTYVRFGAAADDKYLFFVGFVTDPNIISGKHGTDYWNEDSLEFYLNASGNLKATAYQPGIAQITIPPLNIGASVFDIVLGGVNNPSTDAIVQVAAIEGGYAVEVAVPLNNPDVWQIEVFHGSVIGFQVHLNGASENDRDQKYIWSKYDTADSSYFDPRVFGELIFFEIGQTSPLRIEPAALPGPALIEVPADARFKDPTLSAEERAADLLQYMTLEEKIGQMTLVEKDSIKNEDIAGMYIGGLLSGGGGAPSRNNPAAWAGMVNKFQELALESHLGIPIIYGVDAVHGHSNVREAVIFPHNIGLGAAADPELMEAIGQITALEMAATGIYWNYAPAVSVPQDVRWGRTYEGYSEDPNLVSLLATAYLRGLQGTDLAAPNTVLATPKHYLGDGGAVWGTSTTGSYKIDQGVTDVDEATLRSLHLPPYIAAIEAGARSIMISYSSWGGIKMHGQAYLINDVLKGELGFSGFVVSDWGGMDQISSNYYESIVTGINAGIDMNMVPYEYIRFINTMLEAVKKGDISQERIDDAVLRILTVKFEMGLFERPFSNPEYLELVGSEAHRAVARQAVQKSLVLLKNTDDLLPLNKDIQSLFVGGHAADDIGIQSGGWTIEWQGKEGAITPGTTILDGLTASLPGITIEFNEKGVFNGDPTADGAYCLAVVGETPYAEGVGDSSLPVLPPREINTLVEMEKACASLVVVIISGRPVDIAPYIERWDAVAAAFLPGTEGQGVVDVLFGDVPFTGKLPINWFSSADDIVQKTAPLFPIGYGLESK